MKLYDCRILCLSRKRVSRFQEKRLPHVASGCPGLTKQCGLVPGRAPAGLLVSGYELGLLLPAYDCTFGLHVSSEMQTYDVVKQAARSGGVFERNWLATSGSYKPITSDGELG